MNNTRGKGEAKVEGLLAAGHGERKEKMGGGGGGGGGL